MQAGLVSLWGPPLEQAVPEGTALLVSSVQHTNSWLSGSETSPFFSLQAVPEGTAPAQGAHAGAACEVHPVRSSPAEEVHGAVSCERNPTVEQGRA